MKIAVIQKCPSKLDYPRLFGLPITSIYNLSSQKVSRLLKADVDLSPDFDPREYDYCILIGSEALKYFSTKTSITDFSGKRVPGKKEYSDYEGFLGSISPVMLAFKPENKPVFDLTVSEIKKIINGEEVQASKKDYRFYRTSEEIAKELREILNFPARFVALDTETSALESREGYLLGVSLSKRAHHGVYLDADEFDEDCVELLQKIIDSHEVVLHNAKFDMKFLNYHMGIEFDHREGHVHDTMIMHYVLDERQGTHGLKSLALKYTDLGDYEAELDEWKKDYIKAQGIDKDSFSYEYIPWDIIKVYAAKDTDATIQLCEKFFSIIQANTKLADVYTNLHLPALHFLARMEARGIPVSKERLVAARGHLDAELEAYREKLWEYPEIKELETQQGGIFNPNSTQQLRVLLFDILGLKPTGKLTATGAISTDKDSLRELGEQHEIPNLILKIRNNLKLKSTYIDKLLPCINGDSRVRTGFHQVTTTSGRLSSSGRFNMQQLPSNNPLIKGCVVPPKGYKIVALDLTTAEIYYAAVLSGDKAMQQIFIDMRNDPVKYPDFHANIAFMVFNLPCEPAEVKEKFPALRQAAKAISFGILYGSGPAKVAESVNLALIKNGQEPTCTKEQAVKYINDYFKSFRRLKTWIDSCHNHIKEYGFIYNFYGRKRRLRNINSKDQGVASGEVRSGFNAIIQSISSDSLLLGALEADKEIKRIKMDAEIFALVHDSIVAIVREDLVEEYTALVTGYVQKDRGCSIPGCPIGLEADSEKGGSDDYSCGKLEKAYPEISALRA